jgi:hypothetical protein
VRQRFETTNFRAKEASLGIKVNIKEVYFERVFNLGNYGTCRIGLTATVGPDQTAEEVAAVPGRATVKMRNKHHS